MPTRPPVHNADGRKLDYQRQRGNFRQQGYITRWDRLSRHYRRMHPLCLGCESVGRTVLAQCCDHVVPHKGDYFLMWSPDNLQALCHWHHNVIKQKLEQLHAQGLIKDADLRMNSLMAIKLTKQNNIPI
jgi:5-methylcytosine-specific restriction protein A